MRISVTDGEGRPIRDGGLAGWLASVAPARAAGDLGIALVTDRRIRTLNHRYRGKDRPTDVLSFSANGDLLGDIVIARGVARRQAREAGHSIQAELRVLALHGLLHLLGYDHHAPAARERMTRVERRLRRAGGLPSGLIERTSAFAMAPARPRRSAKRGGGRTRS